VNPLRGPLTLLIVEDLVAMEVTVDVLRVAESAPAIVEDHVGLVAKETKKEKIILKNAAKERKTVNLVPNAKETIAGVVVTAVVASAEVTALATSTAPAVTPTAKRVLPTSLPLKDQPTRKVVKSSGLAAHAVDLPAME
jgi:hypothetical protein